MWAACRNFAAEQQREQWLARAVQRGWLQTSGPVHELEAGVPVRGELQLRADAWVFTPEVVWESGAQPQDGEEGVVGSGDDVTGLDGLLQAWQQTPDGRAKMRRVCDQLLWYHILIGKPLEPSDIPELVDDAEAVKGAMAQLMPKGKLDWKGAL